MKFFVPFLFALLSPPSLFAQAEPNYAELFKNLQKLRKDIQQSSTNAPTCAIPDVANCSFGDYCEKLRSQSQNFYLYKNAEGKSFPNFFFLFVAKQAEGCLGKTLPELEVDDPFVDPTKIKKNDPVYQRELARVKKIFADVQERTVKFLESRRTKDNSAAIDQEIKRIKSAKLKSPLFKDQIEVAQAKCSLPNAAYDANDNSISVCPQILNLPDATLFSSLSHEIGHAIDPCNANQEIADTSVPADKNPFQNVISCLQGPTSFGAKSPSKKDLIAAIKKEQAGFEKSLGPFSPEAKAEYAKKIEDKARNFETQRYCRDYAGNSDMQEGFADWMSSKVLVQKISEIKDPTQAKTYAFEAQLIVASTCTNLKMAAINRVGAAVEKNCPAYTEAKKIFLEQDQDGEPDSVPHPKSSRRINKILFAPSEIQKALGCKALANTTVCE